MYCPKCSQQQPSDNIRFCLRCGFQMNAVKALLVNDNTSLSESPESNAPDRSLRKRDMTVGALLMFVFALIVAAITVSMPPAHSARILGLVVAWLVLTVLLNISSIIRFFFNGSSSTQKDDSSSEIISSLSSKLENNGQSNALPPAQSIPVNDFVTEGLTTAEMVQPPSVTEKTTNLLNNNQQ